MSASGVGERARARRVGTWEQPWRFFATAAALMIVAYAFIYFPYSPGSVPIRVLTWYLRMLTNVCAMGARFFDGHATVSGDLIQGRFSLRIVLDCAALDAHAFYVSAVLAFPAGGRQRALGALLGVIALALMNAARIVSLYLVGVHWPAAFHILHEEVFQFAIVLATCCAFWAWTAWVRGAFWPAVKGK